MKCNIKSAPKLMTALVLSALLVACGGGTSGDATDGGDTSGDLNPDGQGLLTGGDIGLENPDELGPDIIDEDLDGIPDQANYVDDTACRGRGGSDPGSTNAAWNDNCTLEYDLDRDIEAVIRSPFYHTTYVKGMQRIVACQEHAGTDVNVEAWSDGFFGVNTRNAVIEFQRAQGLIADGIVGPNTWGKLQEQVDNVALLIPSASDADYNAYGIAVNPDASGAIDCSADINFFGKFSEDIAAEDAFEAWEMSKTAGSAEKGSFSIAAP